MNLKGWEMFGLDAMQQAALQAIINYIETAWTQGNPNFPDIPHWMFQPFDKYQSEDILATLKTVWTSGRAPAGDTLFRGWQDGPATALSSSLHRGLTGVGGSGQRTIVLMGDSITAQNGNVTPPLNRWFIHGFFTWANALSAARFRVLRNSGVSGNTTAQMLARFSTDVLAHFPRFVTIMGGTNDTVGTTASTIANLTAMYDLARANGIYVFALTVPWRSDGSSSKIADAQVVNSAIESYWLQNTGGEVVDVYSITENQPSYFAVDGIHPVASGAYAIGQALATRLSTFGGVVSIFPTIPGDNWASNPASNFTTDNPLFAGTGGTLAGSVTGVLPNSVNATSGSTIPTTASKFTAEFGDGIQLSGQAISAGQTVQLNILPVDAFAGGRIAIGQQYSVVAVFEVVSGGENLSNFNIGSQVPQPLAASSGSVLPTSTPKLYLTTPIVTREAGTSNAPIAVQLTAAGTGAFVVRISRVSIVRY